MEEIIPGKYSGIIEIPASKSDVQRALLCAGLSTGKSELKNVGKSSDELCMLETIKQLGAIVQQLENGNLAIEGFTHFPKKGTIQLGESGLGTRLLTSICTAHPGSFDLIGHGSLTSRPMHFFTNHFPKMGVKLTTTNGCIPLNVEGPIISGNYTVDGSESSQYISGLMMALPLISGNTHLKVENLKSGAYLEMTLNTLQQFGIKIENDSLKEFKIQGNQQYKATDYTCEGDWSSASYWLVAAALGQKISISGLSMKSLQADKALLNALLNANCSLKNEDGLISISGKNRSVLDFDANNCPDLFPALVTYAAFTPGISKIKGVYRLKNKESNRGLVLQKEFSKIGVLIEISDDEMLIHGQKSVIGGTINSNNDHRIAMCFGIAGMFSKSPIIIEESESVSKSYPRFWEDLNGLKQNII